MENLGKRRLEESPDPNPVLASLRGRYSDLGLQDLNSNSLEGTDAKSTSDPQNLSHSEPPPSMLRDPSWAGSKRGWNSSGEKRLENDNREPVGS